MYVVLDVFIMTV